MIFAASLVYFNVHAGSMMKKVGWHLFIYFPDSYAVVCSFRRSSDSLSLDGGMIVLPNISPSSNVSGNGTFLVSGSKNVSNPATMEIIPKTLSGKYGLTSLCANNNNSDNNNNN